MSDYEFKDTAGLNVSQTLLIGLGGPTGAGKTESGIRIARGIAGDNVAVIDTENKRALNKKSRYKFKHHDLQPPYSPENYEGAIKAAIKAGFRAIFVDSFSHEWDGDGGLSEDAAEILERMSKGDAARAERLTALAWKEPKQRHKRLMQFLRKCDVPIIFGLRAEPKIKFQKDANGKMQVIDAGWLPIAEKMFGYDMLIYALMMAENPGVPVHLKKLEPEFEPMFPVGKQITEESGQRLAQWAAGSTTTAPAPKPAGSSSSPDAGGEAGATYISPEQEGVLLDLMTAANVELKDMLKHKSVNVKSLSLIPAYKFEGLCKWLKEKATSK